VRGRDPQTGKVHLAIDDEQRCPSRATKPLLTTAAEDEPLTCSACRKIHARESRPVPAKKAPAKKAPAKPVTVHRRCQACLTVQECIHLPKTDVWVCLNGKECERRSSAL
jgi:hypothetical protein